MLLKRRKEKGERKMRKSDPELERLRSEKEAAQRDIDSAKAQLDRLSPQRSAYQSQIQSINATIADLKQRISSERDAIRVCRAARDRISADTHRYTCKAIRLPCRNNTVSRTAITAKRK